MPRVPHLQRALVEEAARDDEAVAAQRGQLPRAEHLGHRRADSDGASWAQAFVPRSCAYMSSYIRFLYGKSLWFYFISKIPDTHI